MAKFLRWPNWLKELYKEKRGDPGEIQKLIKLKDLHTVCQEAHCPNIRECFGSGKATFLIMGNKCTRNCRFCNIGSGTPSPLDISEIDHIIDSIGIMGLNYIVITSVTRDDLHDGGAGFYSDLVLRIRERYPNIGIELLIPDFKGEIGSLEKLVHAPLDILNHNVETVPYLYNAVRPQANFETSLFVLDYYKKSGFITKSGVMVGLGETIQELLETFSRLVRIDTDILTIGQYLQPSLEHYPVKKYYSLEEFDILRDKALDLGFKEVFSGPFVRSSFKADETKLVKRR
ncbi:lipoyl synthase [bacterium]|nr:lipoyl synthase [bacterium]